MADNLVIVESPAKAKTIKKYLGKDFEVLASYGHVRDLVPKEGAVDPTRKFAMKYDIIERNERHVNAISRALRKAKSLYLATDPDREGEAISWHLRELLEARGDLEGKQVHRVEFFEITRNAVREAVANPRELSLDLVNAQQARRALDYLVGFNLSPLLWKKVRRGLSAGRVQSPALRMICEREAEIQAFIPREYWTLDAEGEARGAQGPQTFPLRLVEFDGRKVEQFSFTDADRAQVVERTLCAATGAGSPAPLAASLAKSQADADSPATEKPEAPRLLPPGALRVLSVDRKQRNRNPAPPFTTSTLQQEAARKLGFGAQRTMRLAQQLYEGVDYGEGAVGLITYMRTDAVNLANEALGEIRQVIARLYGEALIWKRAVACQMTHAVFDTVAIDLLAGPDGPQRHLLRANGSTLVFAGFMAVYLEGVDDSAEDDDDRILPPLVEGEAVQLIKLRGSQHFTEPPPRFSEASLVKSLEEHGIGRPSTYASIITTLKDREYVDMDGRRFIPTDIGRIVNNFLSAHFGRYFDYGFTAAMEDELDAVSRGEESWIEPLRKFWQPFIDQVEQVEKTVTRDEAAQSREIGTDPASGKPVSVRMGRFGPFVQIGTREDTDKPRFAGLRPGQKMNTINFDDAMQLFQLPRKLGDNVEGEPLEANIGRFGPYIKYGAKYASLKIEDDPYTITLERACEVVAAKKVADANRTIQDFGIDDIQVLNGRYGPYITDKARNARIPKDRDPKTLTLEECRALLAAAPQRPGRGRFGRGGKDAAKKGSAKKSVAKKGATTPADGTDTGPAAKRSAAKKTPAKKTPAKKKKTAAKKRAAPKKKKSAVEDAPEG